MKRELMENVKVAPYTSGAAIDRQNFLSAIVAAEVTAAGKLTLTVTHSDTEGGPFTAVADTHIAPSEGKTTDGVVELTVAAGDKVNLDLDLVGCKKYIKVTASGAAASGATYAYALGDAQYAPV
ncbi:hypothetical protein [Desulfitobacterium sp.]|uniref:hypothetical protein n=1 Tax=Desulfitobacterium sp. TaxID=49981 RepID=UPI002B1FBCF3|nr:hypothetical protein [Desulfitobacterium sp.]MEA4901861.1 hypothetical protein [Desulfitobacterium sp.]